MIANENLEETQRILEKLTADNASFEVQIANDGNTAIANLKNNEFDLLILDLVLPSVDGFEVIETAKQINKDLKVIVISALASDIFIKKAMALGINYFMLKPISYDVLSKRVVDIFESEEEGLSKHSFDRDIEEKITNIFITVGIPAHIKGYQFLREAIKLSMENPDIINSITKKLYPSIAEKFDTSASKVERAIRHAIEVAWNRGKIENINNVFGLTVYSNNEKPTNGEFIALVAAVASILVKELLYRYTIKIGRATNSPAVIANAWHHRSDALSSIGALVGIGCAYIFGGKWGAADPIAAIVVAAMILKVAIDLLRKGFDELVEGSLPSDIEEEIVGIVTEDAAISHPHNLRTRRIGANIAIEVHIRVDGDMSVRESHSLTESIEKRLRERFGDGTMVAIHVEPIKIV